MDQQQQQHQPMMIGNIEHEREPAVQYTVHTNKARVITIASTLPSGLSSVIGRRTIWMMRENWAGQGGQIKGESDDIHRTAQLVTKAAAAAAVRDGGGFLYRQQHQLPSRVTCIFIYTCCHAAYYHIRPRISALLSLSSALHLRLGVANLLTLDHAAALLSVPNRCS